MLNFVACLASALVISAKEVIIFVAVCANVCKISQKLKYLKKVTDFFREDYLSAIGTNRLSFADDPDSFVPLWILDHLP